MMGLLFASVPKIISMIADARQKQTDAKTERERIAADREARMWEAQLDARVRAQTTWGAAAFMRIFFAIPFGLYLWKIIVYDKIWMGGDAMTHALGNNEADVMKVVIGFYFLSEVGIQYLRRR